MTDLVRLEGSLWVLNFEDPEVVILCVELLEASHVNLVLKLGDSKVLDLNGVSDGPLKTNRHGWQVVCVLNQLKLSTSMKCLALELDAQRLTVHDLEEDA